MVQASSIMPRRFPPQPANRQGPIQPSMPTGARARTSSRVIQRLTGKIFRGKFVIEDPSGEVYFIPPDEIGLFPDNTIVDFTLRDGNYVNLTDHFVSARARRGRVPVSPHQSKEYVMAQGTYVSQHGLTEYDKEDAVYYHVGPGLAYTYNLATCTALAMYSRKTKISFLCHADDNTSFWPIDREVRNFAKRVAEAGGDFLDTGDVTISIFCTPGTLTGGRSSSATTILSVLKQFLCGKAVNVGTFLSQIRYEEGDLNHSVGRDSYVFVGANHEPSIGLGAVEIMEYAMRRYITCRTYFDSAQARRIIRETLRSNQPLEFGEHSDILKLVFDALTRAKELGDERFAAELLQRLERFGFRAESVKRIRAEFG
jgi:hypothetical protein